MEFVFLAIAAVVCGVVSAMGMGGGSVLIVVLTTFLSFSQTVAQGLNLFSFLPVAIIAIFFHFKNNLIKDNIVWSIAICGVVFSVVFSFFANAINSQNLKVYFGYFLILVAMFQIVYLIKKSIKMHKKTKK